MSAEKPSSPQQRSSILVVDDDPDILLWFRREFDNDENYNFILIDSFKQASEQLQSESFELDLIISDLELGDDTGFQLLELCRIHYPVLPFCIMTAHASVSNTAEALRMGVFDYLEKPLSRVKIEEIIEKSSRFSEIKKENLRLKENLNSQSRLDKTIIAESEASKRVLELARRVASSKASVLILGESGVGKEVYAKQVHLASDRKGEVFLPVNCASLPENLIESELFGHTKGAFTGADHAKDGLVRAADKGTLFLDEIGELPLHLQSKLLRFLQEETVRPVGSNQEYSVDVRIIAATNRKLEQLVQEGKFREDLYFRLNVVPLVVPPLRERVEDVQALVPFFLKNYAIQHNPRVKRISQEAHQRIFQYNWPGNVRELENTIERAVVLCQGDEIQSSDLMLSNLQSASPQTPRTHNTILEASDATTPKSSHNSVTANAAERNEEIPPTPVTPTPKPLAAFHFEVNTDAPISLPELEKRYIERISQIDGLSKEEMAEILDINRKTLYRKQKEYGID